MKSYLTTLNEVLTYILEGMYDAEKQIQKDGPEGFSQVNSAKLKNLIAKYVEDSRDKRTKLKRIFSYLLAGPYKRKSSVVRELRKEWKRTSGMTKSKRLRDVVFVTFIQSLSHYKISEYISARDLTLQLNLQEAADLLDEIVAWEREALNAFTKTALIEVNQKAMLAGVAKQGNLI